MLVLKTVPNVVVLIKSRRTDVFPGCRSVRRWVRGRSRTGKSWLWRSRAPVVEHCFHILVIDLAALLQTFGQQSSYNSSSNQPSYGRTDAGPGIDSSLASHIPGGQGVSTASEQVGANHMLCLCLMMQQ